MTQIELPDGITFGTALEDRAYKGWQFWLDRNPTTEEILVIGEKKYAPLPPAGVIHKIAYTAWNETHDHEGLLNRAFEENYKKIDRWEDNHDDAGNSVQNSNG